MDGVGGDGAWGAAGARPEMVADISDISSSHICLPPVTEERMLAGNLRHTANRYSHNVCMENSTHTC